MGILDTLIPLTVTSSISQLGEQARTLVFLAPASARSNEEQGSKQARAVPRPHTKSVQQLKHPNSYPVCYVKQSKPVLVPEDSILLFLHYSSQALLGLPLRRVLAHTSSPVLLTLQLFSLGVTSAKAI